MSLESLLKIGRLKTHPTDAREIEQLLAAARRRNALRLTAIQSLPPTVEIDNKRVIVLDARRRQRNVADYSGDDIDESTAEHCIAEAQQLIDDVESALQFPCDIL